MSREEFVSLYPVVKTVSFELKPQGKTHETILSKKYFEYDEMLEQEYQKMKPTLDLYHRSLIQAMLETVDIQDGVAMLYEQFYLADDELRRSKDFISQRDALLEQMRSKFVVSKNDKALKNRFNHLNLNCNNKLNFFGPKSIQDITV